MDGKFFDREALEELSKEGVTLVSWSNIWARFVSLVKVIGLSCTYAAWLQIHWCSLHIFFKKGTYVLIPINQRSVHLGLTYRYEQIFVDLFLTVFLSLFLVSFSSIQDDE